MTASARWYVGPLHAAVYLGLSLAWMITIAVVASAVLLAVFGIPAGPDGLSEATLGAGLMGALTAVQTLGLGALAVGLTLLVPRGDAVVAAPPPRAGIPSRLRAALALDGPTRRWWAAGVVIGGTIGWVAGAVAEWMTAQLPAGMPDSLAVLADLFATAPPAELAVLVFAVCVVAPVVEELVFRGYLWTALSTSLPAPLVLLCTTLLFAAYHVYPVQAVALLPTSLLLGWLRWRSGSLWVPIVAHAVNNVLATVGAVLADPGAQTAGTPLWQVGLAGGVVLGSVLLLEFRRQR